MSRVDFTDNSDAALAALEKAKARALEYCGEIAESYAKALCPVDTGNLRNSITHMRKDDDEYIGTNVEYGPYVELGTRKMAARPFLRPAATEHGDLYNRIMQHELENA